ncbi:hypothetical protein [Actinokineospora fastidiosa]|uniref:Uncharacterized protein n=1 Tax=Actinokineospora fastidiosa TaxID=1816 RepID=A0A918GNL7_9PSEU|nr:hypothetical protein [Actinokineospora fastidiosa]GGS45343.1 hypothetical protein GCM10010171_45520 [Actinokineospora fastidiosa]
MEDRSGPLRRLLAGPGGAAADLLAGLPGADLTTLQLEVARRRAARLRGPDVLRRYRADRFTGVAPLPFAVLRRVEDVLLDTLPAEFERVTLSPLAPLGTHSAVAGLSQHRVVSTARGTEVAADPTNGLALEAAVRRSGRTPVRLAAVQRVVRAQRIEGAGMFAHFGLLGMVSAGRDAGGLGFEKTHLVEHARYAVAALRALGAGEIEFRTTVLDPAFADLVHELKDIAAVRDYPERDGGRSYYEGLCFKICASFGAGLEDVGDGGFTPWTRTLLGNAKERLLTSGLGIDRLAGLIAP